MSATVKRISVDRTAGSHALYKRLLLGTALAALVTAPALANPTGGAVSTGAATITSNGSNTSVKQTSEGVVINWSSFNIGNGQTTQFYQPNSKAIAVNRIGAKNASQILGTLDANGNVVLINGNGILFGKGSKVDVGSLVATSTDGTDSDVLSGKFTKAGSQSATIVNRGAITTGAHGTVALVAPNVTNSGTVNAKLGTVTLGAANKFTIDLNGDGLVSFAAQGDVNGKASVTNSGRLVGANVSMTAHAAEGIATGVVNTSGVIVAQGAHEVGGTIVLDAGDGGSIDISGGKLEAKGPKGGGTITVGSWDDASVTVNTGALLNASATKTGDGGHIKVVSNSTSFAGNALAQGGILSGNGGLIETSGHTIDFLGSTISASASHGKSGTWLLDPDDLTIDSTDANSISSTLEGGTNVSLQTTASGCSGGFGTCTPGAGDINIDSGITWDTSNTLSLDAWHSININYALLISGAGGLNLQYNDAATDGTLNFGPHGQASFLDVVSGATQGTLTISGELYTLENNFIDRRADILSNPVGFFALAENYDASANGTYNASAISTNFEGTFEGLGNTISNLSIYANNAPSDEGVGLFSSVGGTVRDLNISGSVTGNTNVGALVGTLQTGGNVTNVTSSVNVTGFYVVGGLIGESEGTVLNSSSSGTVTGQLVDALSSGEPQAIGGLIGQMDSGLVSDSYATGNVTALGGNAIGGLIGYVLSNNNAMVANSFATGNVDGGFDPSSLVAGSSVGGLIGDNAGQVTNSYATGTVLGTQNVGGLIGINENDAPGSDAENPTGDGTVTNSFATGNVTGYVDTFGNEGIDIGGLIGFNEGGVHNAYSMGAVTGGDQLGGLVGTNEGSLHEVYSTGMVTAAAGATPTNIGGLVGAGAGSDILNAYWDTQTSGITDTTQGAGDQASLSGITGMATAALQGTLPTGFNNGGWGTGTNLFPYLTSQYPSGTPQSLSGIAYTDAGSTIDAGDTVTGLLDGNSINTASTGANGYFYFLLAPGSLSGTDAAYVATSSGATIADSLSASKTGMDIWGTYLRDLTADSDALTANSDAETAVGSNLAANNFLETLPNLDLVSSAASFSVNGDFTGSGNTIIKTTAGDLTIDFDQEQEAGTLTLDSYANIFVRQVIYIDTGANLTLVTNDGGSAGHLGFQGGYAQFESATSNLTINTTPYTIVSALPQLISDIAGDPSGDFAFSPHDGYYDATGDGTYTSAPIPTTFTGKLEGLGAIIDNLTINDTGSSGNDGLFANIGSGGSVENLILLDESVTSASGGNVGGLAGTNAGSIYNVYVGGDVTSSNSGDSNVGGFVGENDGSIAGGGFDGIVETNFAVGGLFAGYNRSGATISTSYALGSVSGSSSVAGFVGDNAGQITDSYTTAAVTGTFNDIAGFVNFNGGTISNSYTASTLSGGSQQAGFANFNQATIENSVWDEDTTGDHSTGYNSSTGTITGLTGVTSTSGTTAFDESTYTALGFTFGAGGDWYMVDGQTRPFLQAEYSSYILNAHQLQLMAMNLTEEYFLGADIAYDGTMWSSAGFAPVGTLAHPFQGQLEGDDYNISGLNINLPTQDYVGIIGYAGDFSDISEVTVVGGSVTGDDYVGALAGYSAGSGAEDASSASVTGAYNTSTLVGGNYVGGLIGDYEGSGFGNAEVTGNVSGNKYVGGAIGYEGTNAIVEEVVAQGNVSGIEYVGGFAGYDDGVIEESDAGGNVAAAAPSPTSSAIVGGIGGFIGVIGDDAEVGGSVATGDVSATGTNTNPARGVGGFAGVNLGEIEAAAANGTASGQAEVGGFIGYNKGSLGEVFSTGKATGDINVGGLIGYNDAGGYVEDSYSLSAASVTGSFNGHDGDVGGLVGDNLGGINQTFSAGMVTCSAADSCAGTIGAFVGVENGAIEATNYFDTYTSGFSATQGVGTNHSGDGSHVVGEGTAALQSGLAGSWDSSVWGIVPGVSYPYLLWQTSGDALQVVSGVVQNTAGTQNLSGVDVSALVDGGNYSEGAMASGADGYYYVMLTPGAIISGSNVLAYITDTGVVGNTVETQVAAGSLGSVGVHEGLLAVHTSDTDSTQLTSDLLDAVGDASGTQFLYTYASGFTPGAQVKIWDSASNFDVDSALDFGTANVDLVASGTVSEDVSDGSITAAILSGSSSGGTTSNGANSISDIQNWTNSGAGGFALTDAEQLRIGGEISSGTGNLDLTTTSGTINVDGELNAGNTIDIVSAHNITENATSGSMVAGTLEGSAQGNVTLAGTNTVPDLGPFNTNGGTFSFQADEQLRIAGEVQTGAGSLSLTTTSGGINVDGELLSTGTIDLTSAGSITGNASGIVDAGTLAGSSHGGLSLVAANMIGNLGSFSTNNGGFALSDGETLTTLGTINTGSANVSLTTTAGDIDIDSTIDAHTFNLNSAGAANENASGAIVVHLLNVTAQTGIDLGSSLNNIANIGTDTTTSGPNTIDKN